MATSDRQRQILAFITDFMARTGTMPTLADICRGLGLTSTGSLLKHLRDL